MNRSDLAAALSNRLPELQERLAESAVKSILEQMAQALAQGRRIEVRGFGSFSVHVRAARTGRNPRSGVQVQVPEKHVPHFKPGKALRQRVDRAA